MKPQSSYELNTQLLDLLQQQLHLVNTYNDYLGQIKQSITSNDSEKLNQLLSQPPLDITQIEKNRQQQIQLLAQHGYEDGELGIQEYIQGFGDVALKKCQQSLIQHIKQLEKSLLINDLLIRKNQHRVRQTLQILSGHGLSDKAVTYSRQGDTAQQDDNKRSLAQA